MKKNELEQIVSIKKEIALLEKEIEEAEYHINCDMVSDVVGASSISFPYIKYSAKVTGIDIKDYDKKVKRLKNKYTIRIKELMNKIEEANEYISSIKDSDIRIIITLKYLNGMTWQQIASTIGVLGDGSTERKKLDRFFKYSRNS